MNNTFEKFNLILAKHNLGLSPQEVIDLFKYFRYGMSVGWIFNKMGISKNLILKLKRDKDTKSILKISSKKYYCNHDFFKKIDTEQKAYWLGFIYADGCVTDTTVNILLKGDDSTHLEKYKRDIEAEHPIEIRIEKIRDKKTKEIVKLQHTAKIRIAGSILREDLMKLGCGIRKSLTLTFPSFSAIPKPLIHHFVRGYFDGDGSIWKCKNSEKWGVGFLSTDYFNARLFAYLMLNGFSAGEMSFDPHDTTPGMNYLNFHSYEAMHKIKDFMYKDATVFLDRKKIKFDELKVSKYGHGQTSGDIETIFIGNSDWLRVEDVMNKTNHKHSLQVVQGWLKKMAQEGFLRVKMTGNSTTNKSYQWDEEAHLETLAELKYDSGEE